jgi:hypothetical protein
MPETHAFGAFEDVALEGVGCTVPGHVAEDLWIVRVVCHVKNPEMTIGGLKMEGYGA